jgi:ABC-type transport system substrate-binding protein
MKKLIIIFALLQIQTSNLLSKPKEKDLLYIINWPNLDSQDLYNIPSTQTTVDPLIGRVLCPPIFLYNQTKQQFDNIVTHAPNVKVHNGKQVWTYRLRKNIFWWDAKEVTVSDLKNFLLNNLEIAVKQKSLGLWKIPKFTISTHKRLVKITWSSSPVFGPYVFSGLAFFKAQSYKSKFLTLGYQCVGNYRPHRISENKLELQKSPGYKLTKAPHNLVYLKNSIPTPQHQKNTLRFHTANTVSVVPNKRDANFRQPCSHLLDLPYVSSIIWHPRTDKAWLNPALRSIINKIIPREFIISSACGGWAKAANFLNENKTDLLDIIKANKQADQYLGSKNSHKWRKDKFGKTLTLTLKVYERETILAKVLVDLIQLLGIKCELVVEKSKTNIPADLSLIGLRLPYPELNMIASLHSNTLESSDSNNLFAAVKNKKLDRLLLLYASRLSWARVDNSSLRQIFKALTTDNQLFYFIIQHKVCLSGLSSKNKINSSSNWFRDFLLQQVRKKNVLKKLCTTLSK